MRRVREPDAEGARTANAVRQALARDLHDGVARTLVTMLMELETFRAEQHGRESVLREVDVFETFVRSALLDIRRVLFGLQQEPDLADGLLAGLRRVLVPTFERFYKIPVTLTYSGRIQDQLPEAVELAAYRVAQEALVNVGRHSGAASAFLSVQVTRAALVLEVADDGRGFEAEATSGFGTRAMRERVMLAGGRLEIHSSPSAGTRVRMRIPLPRGQSQRLVLAG